MTKRKKNRFHDFFALWISWYHVIHSSWICNCVLKPNLDLKLNTEIPKVRKSSEFIVFSCHLNLSLSLSRSKMYKEDVSIVNYCNIKVTKYKNDSIDYKKCRHSFRIFSDYCIVFFGVAIKVFNVLSSSNLGFLGLLG